MNINIIYTRYKNRSLSLLIILAYCVFLVACGSSGINTTQPTTIQTPTTNTTNTATNISTTVLDWVTGAPIAGAKVLLNPDNMTAVTDAKGVVSFIGATTGKHDFHVFKNAYISESIYQTTASNLNWTLRSKKKSYINVSVQLQLGALAFGEKLEVLMQENTQKQLLTSSQCTLLASTYNCSLILDGVDVGVAVDMQLYVLKRDINGDVIDAINNGVSTWITKASASSVGAQSLLISMNTIKPGRSDLALLQSTTPPIGMNTANVSALLLSEQGTVLSSGTGVPIIFNSFYNTTVFTDNIVWLTANTAVGDWRKSIKHNPVGNLNAINLTANIATKPNIAAQNAGGVNNYSLVFTPAGGSFFTTHKISFRDNTGADVWHLYCNTTTGTITLPIIPNGIAPVMQTGGQHQVIVQALAIDTLGFDAFINTYMVIVPPLFANKYTSIEWASSAATSFTP
ncbi:MAG: hypothetical protein R8K21_05595 [Mariprofundales bacterium]